MRVIAGTSRGKKLATLKGNSTRPTADRVREALFSILYSSHGPLQGQKVLDLFAGTGALAIEALSRGASHAWLVEKAPDALQTIQKNLISCHFSDHATVISGDIRQSIPQLKNVGSFDVIFLDPPYRQGLALSTLQELDSEALLGTGGIVSVETAAEERLPEQVGRLQCSSRRRYGTTVLHFYGLSGEDSR